MTSIKTTTGTPRKSSSRTDSVNRRTFATFLRLFGLWTQLLGCDPSRVADEYHPNENIQDAYVLVSTPD